MTFLHKNINYTFDYNLLKYLLQHSLLVYNLGINFDT